LLLRSVGAVPSVASRIDVWVVARMHVRPTSTVIGGTSRLLTALDPVVWGKATGGPPAVQLTTAGASSIRLLEHLAEAPDFHGTVVVDVVPFFTFDAGALPTQLVDLRVEAWREALRSPARRIEAYLRTWIPSVLAFRRPGMTPLQVLERGGLVPNRATLAVEVRRDGFAPVHYRRVGMEPNTDRVLSPASFAQLHAVAPDSAKLADDLRRLSAAVASIRSRGGSVVLVHMPACGGRRVVEERLFPKARYWGAVRRLPGVIALDLDDWPGAADLACFDGSHVDREDAPRITRWIATSVTAARPPAATEDRTNRR